MAENSVKRNNKGFTLVELVVVLVILAILAALLIPALLGYVDRAKNEKYIVEAKEIMRATQAGIVEAYANDKENFKKSVRHGPLSKSSNEEDNYGYFSNNWAGLTMAGKTIDYNKTSATDTSGGLTKKLICEKLVPYLETKNYSVSTVRPDAGDKASKYKGQCAFYVAYNIHGQIVYMQYANENRLVTFDGKSFKVENDGAFVAYVN